MTKIPAAYFEELYRGDADPWGFETRWYESRKYAITVACLPQVRYGSAFEAGCANGVLSERLAGRCDHLLAADASETAVGRARSRLESLDNVEVRQLLLPDEWPGGQFDLVVLSEILYYLDEVELERLLEAAVGTMRPGAEMVAVHWLGATDYPLRGERVHEIVRAHAALESVGCWREPEFQIDILRLSRRR
ncbi:MAG: SAM-dependent methyltransferase [Acidimicrobiales bacterium]